MQGNTDTALEHVECPREVVDPTVSTSSHSVVEELPVIGNYEPSSEFSETHESIDTANYVDSDDTETPTTKFLMTSLRFWASTFSVSQVQLTALLSILRVSSRIA